MLKGGKPDGKEHWMKQPFWIVNSLLFFLVIFTLLVIYLSHMSIPERESIEPVYIAPQKDRKFDINIRKIYEDDLFGTYKKEQKPIKKDVFLPFPEPPSPQRAVIETAPVQKFLDPLDITLKGIVVISTDDAKNRAMIEDNKTKREDMYKVGDVIEDSQLMRIFRNKVIFLRSNGQQEVLYLREQDAKLDPAFAIIDGWDTVIQKINETNYLISPKEFAFRITNLAQFIDLIGLKSAYQKGKIIGCQVGSLKMASLGLRLGLKTGDIILSINNVPATDTANRLKIYNNVIGLALDDTIKIELLRNKQRKTLHYTLQEFGMNILDESKKINSSVPLIIQPIKEDKKEAILKEKHKFAPTVKEIRVRERENMLQKGKIFQ